MEEKKPVVYPKRKLTKDETIEIHEILADCSFSDEEITETYKISTSQLAGFKAVHTKRNNGNNSYSNVLPNYDKDDGRPVLTKEAAIKHLMSGASPAKLAYAFQGIEEDTLIAYKAQIAQGTYDRNPDLLHGNEEKKNVNKNGKKIKTPDEMIELINKREDVRDLSLLALSLGPDSGEIEDILMQLYGERFRSKDELHRILKESKENLVKLFQEGVVSLGSFIGEYALPERGIAPIIIGSAMSKIPIEKATPGLEKMLFRVASGIYDSIFNEAPRDTISSLAEKAQASNGLAKKIYSSLVSNYEGALEIGEHLKGLARGLT